MTDRLLGVDPTTVTGERALVVLARAATRAALPVAAVIILVSFAVRGVAGGITALVAAIVLVGLHVGSARVSARIAKGNPTLLPALTMLGLIVRLSIYGGLILIFDGVAGLDVTVLAITVVTLTVTTLLVESVVVARYSKFWWQPTETAVLAVDVKDPA